MHLAAKFCNGYMMFSKEARANAANKRYVIVGPKWAHLGKV